jgi:hypothetical protein
MATKLTTEEWDLVKAAQAKLIEVENQALAAFGAIRETLKPIDDRLFDEQYDYHYPDTFESILGSGLETAIVGLLAQARQELTRRGNDPKTNRD